MIYRRLVAGALLFFASCGELPHESPFDEQAPLNKQAKAQISGVITLENETDHSQIAVQLQNADRTYSVQTQPDGSVSLTGVVPGDYTLTIGTRYFEHVTEHVTVKLAEQLDLGTRTLAARRTGVVGQAVVEDKNGNRAGGVTLTLTRSRSIRSASKAPRFEFAAASTKAAGPSFTAQSDASGDYQFNGVPAGVYTMVATQTGTGVVTVPEVTVTGEDGDVQVKEVVLLPMFGFLEILGKGPGNAVNTPTVTVKFTATGNPSFIELAFDPGFVTSLPRFSYRQTEQVDLPLGDGLKALYVRYFDANGNESSVGGDTVVLDTTGPQLPSVTIMDSEPTNSATLTVKYAAVDAASFRIAEGVVCGGAAEPYLTGTRLFTGYAGEGTKTVAVEFFDAIGNSSGCVTDSIYYDPNPPVALANPFRINMGAAVTSSNVVTLNFNVSSAAKVRVSEDSSFSDTNWTPYSAAKTFVLSAGNGTKNLYAEVSDNAGNTLSLATQSISLDTTPPSNPYLMISGDVTTSTTVRLFLGAGLVQEMKVSENADFSGASWWPVVGVTDVTVSNVDGLKTIYAKFRKSTGIETSVVSDTIVLDRAAPVLASVRVNGGADVVGGNVVTLNLSAVDETSGLASYQVASANDFTAILPRTFQANDLFSLPGTDGLKDIWVRYVDRAGNYSAAVSTTVFLDTTAPGVASAALQLPDGSPLTPGQLITSTRVFLVSAVGDATALEMQISYSGTFAGASWEPYSPNRAIDLALPSGAGAEARSVKARVRDAAGHVVDLIDISVNLDSRAPTGSVVRTSPSPATTYTVALTLSASEAPSEAQVSTDPTFAGASWFATINTTVVLPAGDGLRTIYARFRDSAGNVSGLYSTNVEIDATPPQLTSFSIAEGALTWQTTVTLVLGALGATEVQVGEGACTGSWYGYTATRSYTFASFANETKTVAVRYRDAAGNTSACLTQTVALDTTAPYPGTPPILINGSDLYATSRTVSLALAATQATEMQVSESMVFSGAAWAPFTTATAVALSAGEGAKTLYVRFRDLAGNVSAAGADSILLDTIAPAFNALNGPSAVSDSTLTLVLTATNADLMRLSENPDFSGASWGAFASPTPFTFSAGTGVRVVYAQIADFAGNESIVRALSVNVDTNAPASPIVAIVEGAYAKTAVVNVQVFADAVSMQRSEDPAFAGASWEPFSAVKTFTLTGLDGLKTVYVRVKDGAGNVSPVANASVMLDTADPVITLYQAEDAFGTPIAATNQLRFYLHLGVTDANPVTVQYSASSVFSGIPAEAAAAIRPWDVLPPVDPAGEARSVWVKVSDAAGRSAVAGPVSVIVDTLGPTAPSISLAASTVSSPTVTVNLSAVGASWAELSNDIGFLTPLRFGYLSVTAYTLPAGDGTKSVYARYADSRGNYSGVVAATVLLDTQAPAAPSIRINTGAAFVTDAGGNVNLSLGANDALSGVTRMKIANAGTGACPAALAPVLDESFAASKPWVLASPGVGIEGTRWVCAAYRDGAGNWSAPVSAAVAYDTKSPSVSGGGITLAGGALYSTSTQVPVVLMATGASEMQLVNGTSFGGAVWEPYRSSLNWLLAASSFEVERTVSVKFRDAAGNETAVYSDGITLDTVAPTTPALAINGGSPYATNAVVTLTLSAFGASAMQISNDGNFDTEGVVAYSTSTAWALPGVDGVKTVYVRYLDAAGNASPVASASVLLDRVAPQSADFSIDEAPRTPLLTIHLTLTATGASEMQISEGTCNGTWVAYSTSAAHNFQSPIDGNKVIAVRFRDIAGNMTACLTKSITLDSQTPLITTMAPRAGPSVGTVVITGLNFGATQGSSQVWFGAVPAGAMSWSNSEVKVVVPNFERPGYVSVRVVVGGASSNLVDYLVIPAIMGFMPKYLSAGESLTIYGTSFTNAVNISFGGMTLTNVPTMSPNQVVVTLPAGVRPGYQDVVVSAFSYPSNPAPLAIIPRIASVTSPLLSNSNFTISGSSFGATQGSSRVSVGGVDAQVVSWSSSGIVASLPVTAPGAGNVEVKILANGVSSNGFEVSFARPLVYSRSPALVSDGTVVALSGLSFGASDTATVNGVAANLTWVNPASVNVEVPGAAAKGGAVVRVYSTAAGASNAVRVTKRGNDVWYVSDTLTGTLMHSSVWTGSHMIIWGGRTALGYASAVGAMYSPATDTWMNITAAGAPSARFDASAVWTGREMIVWAGCEQGQPGSCAMATNTGGRYDPFNDTWRSMAASVLPAVTKHTAVWTGEEMIVWGGRCSFGDPACADANDYSGHGGRYNPKTDAWEFMDWKANYYGVAEHTAVWTGSRMVVWGGRNDTGALNLGFSYIPATRQFVEIIPFPNARYAHTAVWTGTEMWIYGGRWMDNSAAGGLITFDPATEFWNFYASPPGMQPRYGHTAHWTGTEMIVYGGTDGGAGKDDGWYFSSLDAQWYQLPAAGAPAGRFYHSSVWTGSELIVYGGTNDSGMWPAFGDGGRISLSAPNWTGLSSDPSGVVQRYSHLSAWTGSEMLVWGGYAPNTGAQALGGDRYNPSSDTWLPMSTVNEPSPRSGARAVWTGSKWLVLGGNVVPVPATLDGAMYTPSTNTWNTIAPGQFNIAPRQGHQVAYIPGNNSVMVWGGQAIDGMGTMFDTGEVRQVLASSTAFIANVSTVGAPTGRKDHSMVTLPDDSVMVFGGMDSVGTQGNGARYAYSTNSWTPIAATVARGQHDAVFDGTRVLVWGGQGTSGALDSGERYDWQTDTWSPMSTVGAPTWRTFHSLVYTGSVMVVWGGLNWEMDAQETGGRYDPVADAWSPTTLTGAPGTRISHTAVWAGDRMIVFGGFSQRPGLAAYFVAPKMPAISTISETYANVTTQVTITGAWFGATQGASEVLVGGEPAAVASWSDTSITFTVSPDSPSGAQDVTVVVNGEPSNVRTVTVTPTFGALSASAGKAGDEITISGSGFGPGGTVKLGFWTEAQIVSWSSTQIVFLVPADVGFGTHAVTVDVGPFTSNPQPLLVQPAVTGVTPNPAEPWEPVTVLGSNFGYWPDGGGFTVDGEVMGFNGWQMNSAMSWLQNVTAGTHTVGIKVVADATTSYYAGSDAPRIISSFGVETFSKVVAGATGSVAGVFVGINMTTPVADMRVELMHPDGTWVTLLEPGTYPANELKTWLGVTFPTAQPLDQLRSKNPNGTWYLRVSGTNQGMGNSWMNAWGVGLRLGTALEATTSVTVKPKITTVDPAVRPAGRSVNIGGYGFGNSAAGNAVYFGSTPAVIELWESTSVRVTVPAVAAGFHPVTIKVNGLTSTPKNIEVTAGPPVLSSLSPGNGPSGTTVTLAGQNFGSQQSVSGVYFGAETATVLSWSSSLVQVVVPGASPPGVVPVTVRVGYVPSNALSFEHESAIVFARYPHEGTANTLVTLNGENFGAALGSATVGGVAAQIETWSDTQVQIRVPAGTPKGYQPIRLATAVGDQTNPVGFIQRGPDVWIPMGGDFLSGRTDALAVWTGTEMVLWGGRDGSGLRSGARYNPLTDSWLPVSPVNAPSQNGQGFAVWTGMEAIFWVGSSGGRYFPAGDSWLPISNTGAPSPRGGAGAVWADGRMLVWGGRNPTSYLSDGGEYVPSYDAWFPIPATGAPAGRERLAAVWTGQQLLVWGGQREYAGGMTLYNDGAKYNPSTKVWTAMNSAGAPAPRMWPSAVWSGSELIVWGGLQPDLMTFDATGSRYNSGSDTWSPISNVNAPSARVVPTAVWTNQGMFIWGGCTGGDGQGCTAFTQTGALYDPAGDTWSDVPVAPQTPSARLNAAAVYTGSEVLIWGGEGADAPLDNGARFNSATLTWAPMAGPNVQPAARSGHSAVWTGTELLVWGGCTSARYGVGCQGYTNSGARYRPLTDDWVAMSAGGAPQGVTAQAAVWAGDALVTWGGWGASGRSAQGGAYHPAGDSWTPIGAIASARMHHTAVWTGNEVVFWGGYDAAGATATGVRYVPSSGVTAPVSPSPLTKRGEHAAGWLGGTAMIVWGGSDGSAALGDGALYYPAANAWGTMTELTPPPSPRSAPAYLALGTTFVVWGGRNGATLAGSGAAYDLAGGDWYALPGAPIGGRVGHTLSFVNQKLVVWGGFDGNWVRDDGAVFDTATNAWSPMAPSALSGRSGHSAVSTGSELLIWGGGSPESVLNSGARYLP